MTKGPDIVEPAQNANTIAYDESEAIALIRAAQAGRKNRDNETVVRQRLVAGLALVFPSKPWWIERHILGAEAALRDRAENRIRAGFADSIVGLTAIEYERDLTSAELFTKGKAQVRQYCAGLLNAGAQSDRIRGVLSDTVEWHAYRLKNPKVKQPGDYGPEDFDLDEIENLSVIADADSAERFTRFLQRYLGRSGVRPLTGASIADYFAFESAAGSSRLDEFSTNVKQRLAADPSAKALVTSLWTEFVSYLSTDPMSSHLDVKVYAQELYISTLAKLLCANVIERRPLESSDAELDRILRGEFFTAKGLDRLVEHDYFGWLFSDRHIASIRPLARQLQKDLVAYDFESEPRDDLFGEILTFLASRTQRILLGQEWTPLWLADQMAGWLFGELSNGEAARFIDMCCGSGSMLVATTKRAQQWLSEQGVDPESQEYLDLLTQAATGFDIDPLAVILAKVNWVAANRDALGDLNGSRPVSVPVYHADSLFALGPTFDNSQKAGRSTPNTIKLLDRRISLPQVLTSPDGLSIFDKVLDGVYSLAHTLANGRATTVDPDAVAQLVADVVSTASVSLSGNDQHEIETFVSDLANEVAALERDEKNGVWIFVLRNAYRPGLLAGRFNGLICNPPWLALSKIGDNPFGPVLRAKAEILGLQPSGSSAPHLDMATVHLAHSVDHYLTDGAAIACVLPDTVRTGGQHYPFRVQLSEDPGKSRFPLAISELWEVAQGTFKNRATVLVGSRARPTRLRSIPGRRATDDRNPSDSPPSFSYHVRTIESKMVWSEGASGGALAKATYPRGAVAQGADIMPRRLVFFDIQMHGDRVTVTTPQKGGASWFLIADSKLHKDFKITTRTMPDRFSHPCLLSKHLAPFSLADPSPAILPVVKAGSGWRQATAQEIAASPSSKAHFDEVAGQAGLTISDFFAKLNFRNKLTQQEQQLGKWLVVYGAGGGIPAAAHTQINSSDDQVLLDQTLYGIVVDSENEALYLSGIINSEALLARVADFMPEGAFGDRHIHKLPVEAIPRYTASDATHRQVVEATLKLTGDLAARRATDEEVARLFTTETSMNARRQQLRRVIAGLPSYDVYEKACENLYIALRESEAQS